MNQSKLSNYVPSKSIKKVSHNSSTLNKSVENAQREALRRFVTQMVEQEYEDKKIARQAKVINEKSDSRQMQVL